MKTVYLAGPDVFAPDPVALGAAKKAICLRHGLTGVYPMDVTALDPGWSRLDKSLAVYDGLVRAMSECDGILVNMTPFAGISADVGSAFEMGFMASLGRPVFAYSNSGESLVERAKGFWGEKAQEGTEGEWRDPAGMEVDALGEWDNLMLDGAVIRSTGVFEREAVPEGELYTALGSFERCVEKAADWFRMHAS